MQCLSTCLSVRLSSVTFVCILLKRINISSNFSQSGSHTILVFFYTKHYGNIPTGTPLTGAKIAIFNQYLVLASISAGLLQWRTSYNTYTSSISCDQQTPPRLASVNLVYDRKPKLYAEDKRLVNLKQK